MIWGDVKGSQSVQCSTYSVCQLFLCDFSVVMSGSQSARVSEIVTGESSLIAQFFFNPVRQEKQTDWQRWTWINYTGTGGDRETAKTVINNVNQSNYWFLTWPTLFLRLRLFQSVESYSFVRAGAQSNIFTFYKENCLHSMEVYGIYLTFFIIQLYRGWKSKQVEEEDQYLLIDT